MLINLLDNAVKYGGGTAVDVAVQTLHDEIQVRVRDRGPGIPLADRKRIFERFYRTKSNSRSRGSGIGLAIVKRIAEEHHGRAWAENAEDGGAIVSVAIPRRDPTLADAELESRSAQGSLDAPEASHVAARSNG
jgi:signal transduction histidine kinase